MNFCFYAVCEGLDVISNLRRVVPMRAMLRLLLTVLTCLSAVWAATERDVDSGGHAVRSASNSVDFPEVWWKSSQFTKWLPELGMGLLLLCYIANIWIGRAKNTDVAMAFARTFCPEGSLLDRNFSQVGPRIDGTKDIILRESMSKFNIYATGRRFCKNFQATLDLKHRQDLLYMASYTVSPQADHINIDIAMNEANMQPLVLVIATPRLAKELSKSLADVQSFARPIEVSQHLLPGFPSKSLRVWTESKSTFYDLMTEKIMDLLFGRAAFEEASKYFRYLHFSSENPEGFSKHSLKLSFNLPPQDQMQDLTKALTATLHFIDVSPSRCSGCLVLLAPLLPFPTCLLLLHISPADSVLILCCCTLELVCCEPVCRFAPDVGLILFSPLFMHAELVPAIPLSIFTLF